MKRKDNEQERDRKATREHGCERAMFGPLPEEILPPILSRLGVGPRTVALCHSMPLYRFVKKEMEDAAARYNLSVRGLGMLPGEMLVGHERGSDGELRARVLRECDPDAFFAAIVRDHHRVSSLRQKERCVVSSSCGKIVFEMHSNLPEVDFCCATDTSGSHLQIAIRSGIELFYYIGRWPCAAGKKVDRTPNLQRRVGGCASDRRQTSCYGHAPWQRVHGAGGCDGRGGEHPCDGEHFHGATDRTARALARRPHRHAAVGAGQFLHKKNYVRLWRNECVHGN